MSWTKLPAIDPHHNPCLNCPDPLPTLRSDAIIGVGFGSAYLSKDDEVLYDESTLKDNEDWMTCAQAEELAAVDPDHDWRIVLHGPLHGETYQRQDGQWVCVEQNEGFA